jgi:hypothetical protein
MTTEKSEDQMSEAKQDKQTVTVLDRGAILAADDSGHEDVEVPEWGGTVRVKAMTGEQRDAFEVSVTSRDKHGNRLVEGRNVRAKLVARVCVNEKGVRLFSDEDVAALTRKSARALERVFEVGMRLAGMSDEDVASLEGNSSAQSDASTTD